MTIKEAMDFLEANGYKVENKKTEIFQIPVRPHIHQWGGWNWKYQSPGFMQRWCRDKKCNESQIGEIVVLGHV